jgi:hypothetical protein
MEHCDACGADVRVTFAHRSRSASMTHRRTVRLCESCHPFASTRTVPPEQSDANPVVG